ncbi:hypothetical protein [Mucilaginibacter ginsenosidivorans]|nr:hypothetical protein [Mucilaginibacter ginsenosidivorans]
MDSTITASQQIRIASPLTQHAAGACLPMREHRTTRRNPPRGTVCPPVI